MIAPSRYCPRARSSVAEAARSAAACAFSVLASNCSARNASATFWKAPSTVLRYCASATVVGGFGGAFLMQEREAVEQRLGAARGDVQMVVLGENMAATVGLAVP